MTKIVSIQKVLELYEKHYLFPCWSDENSKLRKENPKEYEKTRKKLEKKFTKLTGYTDKDVEEILERNWKKTE